MLMSMDVDIDVVVIHDVDVEVRPQRPPPECPNVKYSQKYLTGVPTVYRTQD